ncbi:MAG: tetratricopeptide repeat protein, partial [Candidatus Electrothrix sp. AR4]|nr:tetratricopeptide repeat protein [Candidatus Electrothrix sp. AR4]
MKMMHTLTDNLLHTLTKTALVLLIVITAVMLVQQRTAARHAKGSSVNSTEQLQKMYQRRIDQDKKIYLEVETLFEQKKYTAAMDALRKIQEQHPDNPRSLIYQARLQYNTGNMVKAIESYRQAVDKEPDYIDKKTPLFIGKSIMDDLMESKEKLVQKTPKTPNTIGRE